MTTARTNIVFGWVIQNPSPEDYGEFEEFNQVYDANGCDPLYLGEIVEKVIGGKEVNDYKESHYYLKLVAFEAECIRTMGKERYEELKDIFGEPTFYYLSHM